MKKKLVLSLAAAAMVGTLAVGGTLAWFTDTETAANVVTTGHVDVAIYEGKTEDNIKKVVKKVQDEEKEIPGGLTLGGENPVVPGEKLDKIALVKNEGPNAAFIRARIFYTDADGNEIKDTELDALTKLFTLSDAGENWNKDSDGYYYYSKPLDAKTGETTRLMESVQVSAKANNEDFLEKTYKLCIDVEAVQSDWVTNQNGEIVGCKEAFSLLTAQDMKDYEDFAQ